MLISIDYDLTYTRDPELWDEFIASATRRGHEVVCITNRAQEWAPNPERGRVPPVRVICAGDEFKIDAARAAGLNVSIWIDDTPTSISQGLQF